MSESHNTALPGAQSDRTDKTMKRSPVTEYANPRNLGLDLTLWTLVAAALAWCVVGIPLTNKLDAGPLFLAAIPFAGLHGYRRYGGAGILVFVVAAWLISNLFENCGILTGFPFGPYRYAPGGPMLFNVPLLIGFAYIAIGYVSLQVANIVLGQADRRIAGADVVLLPIVAALVMTMFDLVTDPTASTVQRAWAWRDGGGYYGVPYTNFLGWIFVTYVFFQVFTLYLARKRKVLGTQPKHQQLQAIVLYATLGLTVLVDFILGVSGSGNFTDPAGQVWQGPQLREAMLSVVIFTMGFVCLLALRQALRSSESGAR